MNIQFSGSAAIIGSVHSVAEQQPECCCSVSGSGRAFQSHVLSVPLMLCACRRFRALSVWFVLRMYGAERLQEMVRHHIALGEWLGQQVQADNR